MKLTTKQLTLCAVLTALALALSYLENLFPLSLAIPIPGIKLGLANIVTVFALYALGPAQAFLILLARCFLGAVFAGNMNALIFSLLGGVTAMVVMIVLSGLRCLSVYGVSVGGAAAHNCLGGCCHRHRCGRPSGLHHHHAPAHGSLHQRHLLDDPCHQVRSAHAGLGHHPDRHAGLPADQGRNGQRPEAHRR